MTFTNLLASVNSKTTQRYFLISKVQ